MRNVSCQLPNGLVTIIICCKYLGLSLRFPYQGDKTSCFSENKYQMLSASFVHSNKPTSVSQCPCTKTCKYTGLGNICCFGAVGTFRPGNAGRRRRRQNVFPLASAYQAIFWSSTWPNGEISALCRHCDYLLQGLLEQFINQVLTHNPRN